jgi:hypothetical protein
LTTFKQARCKFPLPLKAHRKFDVLKPLGSKHRVGGFLIKVEGLKAEAGLSVGSL